MGDEVKSIYLLFQSFTSEVTAAIYQGDIRIIADDDQNIVVEGSGNSELKKVKNLYRTGKYVKIYHVACAPIGSKTSPVLLAVPDELDKRDVEYLLPLPGKRKRISSNILDVSTGKMTPARFKPEAKKLSPMAMPVVQGDDVVVYVLSRRIWPAAPVPEPSFESYDPRAGGLWNPLPAPPFHDYWFATGFALLDDSSSILFSLSHIFHLHETSFYSFNLKSSAWVPVSTSVEGGRRAYPSWDGEAAVVDGVIYAYVASPRWNLVAYDYHDKSAPSLGFPIPVKGFDPFEWEYNFMYNKGETQSRAVGKIGKRLVCAISTIYPLKRQDPQRVHISVVHIHTRACCRTLASFERLLPCDDNSFRCGVISSCLLLQPESLSDTEQNEDDSEHISIDGNVA